MKQDLRSEMLKKRLRLDSHEVQVGSSLIIQTLLDLECVKQADCVMAYSSYQNEPNLMALKHTLLDMGKQVTLPYVAENDSLIAVSYDYDSVMKSNVFGISEPVISSESELVEPDLVLVPGIAFDEAGNRIGYGLGYFDRFLKESDAYKIGICFDMQIISSIDAKPHDVRMDMIVTQRGFQANSRVITTSDALLEELVNLKR